MTAQLPLDVAVVGGCGGHVGLPLALTFADLGLKTLINDINRSAVEAVRAGQMPFDEEGAPVMLRRVLDRHLLEVDTRPDRIADCRFVVFIIGTPVDEHLNPSFTGMHRALDAILPYLRDGQVLVLRSTVFPGISGHVRDYLAHRGNRAGVAFCPERVIQGYSLREFRELPQIVSALDAVAFVGNAALNPFHSAEGTAQTGLVPLDAMFLAWLLVRTYTVSPGRRRAVLVLTAILATMPFLAVNLGVAAGLRLSSGFRTQFTAWSEGDWTERVIPRDLDPLGLATFPVGPLAAMAVAAVLVTLARRSRPPEETGC